MSSLLPLLLLPFAATYASLDSLREVGTVMTSRANVEVYNNQTNDDKMAMEMTSTDGDFETLYLDLGPFDDDAFASDFQSNVPAGALNCRTWHGLANRGDNRTEMGRALVSTCDGDKYYAELLFDNETLEVVPEGEYHVLLGKFTPYEPLRLMGDGVAAPETERGSAADGGRRRQLLGPNECLDHPEKKIRYHLYVDYSLSSGGWTSEFASRLSLVFNRVADLFSELGGGSLPCNVQTLLGSITFFDNWPDPFLGCNKDPECVLGTFTNFIQLTRASNPSAELDHAIFLSGDNEFADSTFGTTFGDGNQQVGQMCGSASVSAVIFDTLSVELTAITIAQLLGHQLGMNHDGACWYVMGDSPCGVWPNHAFSTQSKVDAHSWFKTYYGSLPFPACLEN